MSNSTPTHQNIWKKERKKKTKREKRRGRTCCPRRERERDRKGQGTTSTSMELADRLDLAPVKDKEQWQQVEVRGRVGWELEMWVSTFDLMTSQTLNLLFCFRVYHKINGVGKSIYQNLWFFFFIAGVSEPCQCRIVLEKWKKKKTLFGHWSPASCTRSGVRHVSDTDMSPKMACSCNLTNMSWEVVIDLEISH